jgi:hypothetical protein
VTSGSPSTGAFAGCSELGDRWLEPRQQSVGRRSMRLALILAGLSLASGCTASHDVGSTIGLLGDELSENCKRQIEQSIDGLPDEIECIGLFSDVSKRKLAAGVRPFQPAVPLWSDGAAKQRWVFLPAGKKIDSSDAGEWKFPVGTKMFKEFGYDSTGPVETRLFQKVRDDYWLRTTYVWNAAHTAAKREDAARDIDVGGGRLHHLPSGRECDQCHDGRQDSVLGFEAVSLGTAGASGLSLHALVSEDLLTEPPAREDLEIGDDGTGMSAPVIGWLHINCGVSCHNDDQNSEAFSTGLRLKLDPGLLDGRSSADFSAIKSTVGVKAKTLQWADQTRIVPGDPDNSLLYKLVSQRGGGKNNQMPPIASLAADEEFVDVIATWIRSLQPQLQAQGSN